MIRVRFAAAAEIQLAHIRAWIAERADPATADRVLDELLMRCESLCEFPNRGTPHDHPRKGLQTLPFKRRYTIGYALLDGDVVILGIGGAGQDLDVLTGPA